MSRGRSSTKSRGRTQQHNRPLDQPRRRRAVREVRQRNGLRKQQQRCDAPPRAHRFDERQRRHPDEDAGHRRQLEEHEERAVGLVVAQRKSKRVDKQGRKPQNVRKAPMGLPLHCNVAEDQNARGEHM
jgi:hypothetical protein